MGRDVDFGRRRMQGEGPGDEARNKADPGMARPTYLGGLPHSDASKIVRPGRSTAQVLPFPCGIALAIGSDGRVLGGGVASGHAPLSCSRITLAEYEHILEDTRAKLAEAVDLLVNLVVVGLGGLVPADQGVAVSAGRDFTAISDRLHKLRCALVCDEVRGEEPVDGVPHNSISSDIGGNVGDLHQGREGPSGSNDDCEPDPDEGTSTDRSA